MARHIPNASLRLATLLIVVAVFAWLLAATRPFTLGADIGTAIPLVIAAGVVTIQLTTGRLLSPAHPTESGFPTTPRRAPQTEVTWRRSAPWLLFALIIGAWELWCYLGAPRSSHPTLSSIEDVVAKWHLAKAGVVVVWVSLGALLFRR